LKTVKGNQPEWKELPEVAPLAAGAVSATAAGKGDGTAGGESGEDVLADGFVKVLEAIGGAAYVVSGFDRVGTILRELFPRVGRVVSGCPELVGFGEAARGYADPHELEDVGLAVLAAHFGVAENGACWITEDRMIERALPFIAQNLALVINKKDVVANMHAAYERIEGMGLGYGFATFIAGPSKTADIEQSLVLGAHGPKSMTVFLVDEEMSDAGFY